MNIRPLLTVILTLCALVPAGARADDYTDLVRMVTQGPPESHPVRHTLFPYTMLFRSPSNLYFVLDII